MSGWRGSNRRARLPADWPKRRKAQLEADGYRCRWTEHGDRCPQRATDVDHIQASADNHDELQSLCSYHHSLKSALEGVEAKAAKAAKINSKFRRSEAHPSAW